jgi:2-polyprenyl-6-methoxyphenol hydroxylase-like FAD-dependent oxidoreductase
MRTVLISGAGVAGPTLAFYLARNGFETTVVERSPGQRSSGNPVDVRGPALPVAEEMGVLPRLREAATTATAIRLAGSGRKIRIPGPADNIEVPRADLARILYDAARDHAQFVFDDTITSLTPGPDGVEVTFERAAPRRFDLVVGADGLHSTVRRLAFGPAGQFVRHLGLFVATLPLGRPVERPDEMLMYNAPGRMIGVHPGRDEAMLAFIFRGAAIPGFDHRDTEQHRRIVLKTYGKDPVPEFLDRVRAADDLYFDGVSRVVLPSWSRGRVTLVGDAAASVSLFGDGSSMAMAGARTLAQALAGGPDLAAGLRRYEVEHRRRTDPKGRAARLAAAMLVPRTRPGIAVRNTSARLLMARGAAQH